MKGAPPLRFLAIVLGGWVCLRAAILAPDWFSMPAGASEPNGRPHRAAPSRRIRAALIALPPVAAASSIRRIGNSRAREEPTLTFAMEEAIETRTSAPPGAAHEQGSPNPPFPEPAFPAFSPAHHNDRWSGSAWLFVRRGGARQLAANGLLGGSQIGARITYRLNRDTRRPLSLSGRFYVPLGSIEGAEAALGVEWKPVAWIPVRLLAERREAIGREGRSAFALMAHGGIGGQPLPGGWRLDAYGQAGVVDTHARGLFADGSARISRPVDKDRINIGAGLWAAAQPGVSRVDIGPHASVRLPAIMRNIRLEADWRFRIAGDAAPSSGPSLTLAADF